MKNDTIGIRQRIKGIAKVLVENHQKWEAAHRRGIALCFAIEKCKDYAIKSFQKGEIDPALFTLYPNELKLICDKLQVITTIFEDIRDSANDSKRQVDAFIKLGATNVFNDSSIVFKTWTCDTIQKKLVKICSSYEREYEIKIKVMENIAHSKTIDDLVLHSSVWEFQTFVDADIDLIISGLTVEADVESEPK